MESVTAYIDHAKTVTKSKSDSQLAGRIGVTRNTVHQWRKGISLPSEDVMIALAERANLDQGEALILLGLWRSHGETKAAYSRLLKLSRMASKTFAYIILLSLASWTNSDKTAVALHFSAPSASQNFTILIIMRKLAKVLHGLKLALRGFTSGREI